MTGKYVMALDQGTTSSRCILFDHAGNICSMAQKEFTQLYPQPGWVEHNPREIWSSQLAVAIEAMANVGAEPSDIAAIGITNQRETTLVWNKETGEPVYNAIVWQCRRTSDKIDSLVKQGYTDLIQKKTGLVPDAYFSGSKIGWILDHVEGTREDAKAGKLLFGTVDTWLIWNLTKGKTFVTDYTNASRTMLFDIHNLCWNCFPYLISRNACCRRLSHPAVFMERRIPVCLAAGFPFPALLEINRLHFSDSAVLKKEMRKIHTEQVVSC